MTSNMRAVIVGLLVIAVIALAAVPIVLPDSDSQIEALRQQLDAVTARLAVVEAAERPWVATSVTIAGNLTIDADGVHVPLRYELANSGRLPAFNVIVNPTLIASAAGAPLDVARALETRCGDVAGSVARASQGGATMSCDYGILPGKQIVGDERADMPPPDKQAADPIYLISCVDYRTGHTTERHQTGDAFYLRRAAPGGVVDIDLTHTGRIPAAELRLVPALRGSYAN